jgi:hypothetical protein
MRKYAWLILSAGLVLSLVGCGDSGSSNDGGTATVSGVVYVADDGSGTPFEGATVSVVGGASTTSGVGGVFSLEWPIGFGTLVATAPGHWGELQVGYVKNPSGLTDVETELVPDSMVAEVAAALMQTVDPGKGIVAVDFDSTVAGYTADLGVNYGFAFVFNSEGEPELGTELLPAGGSSVIFVNVDVNADAMPSAKNATGVDCTLGTLNLPGASLAVQAKVISSLFVTC